MYELIEGKIFEEEGVKMLSIETDDERIDYRLAILLDPSETYYQVFGNMEHLKEIESKHSTAEEQALLEKVDLNEISLTLFPRIRAAMSDSALYQAEVKRKREAT